MGGGCPATVNDLALPTSISLPGFTSVNFGGVNIAGAFVTGTILSVDIASASSFTESCNGDGGDQMGCTDCPCFNNIPTGNVGGCVNSAGTSTRLRVSGTSSIKGAPWDKKSAVLAAWTRCT